MDPVSKESGDAFPSATVGSFFASLRPSVLEELYENPAPCLAVFRDLPSLAQLIVMRMLSLGQPLCQATVQAWFRTHPAASPLPSSSKTLESPLEESLGVLKSLNILQTVLMPNGMPGWLINPRFRGSVQVALVGASSDSWNALRRCSEVQPDQHKKDVVFLDAYVKERWELVLQFLSGGKIPKGNALSNDTLSVLLQANLMKTDATDGFPVITNQGFRFLLMNSRAQVWSFLIHLLDMVESKGMRQAECINLLFELSFAELGTDYSTDGIPEHLGPFLQMLREIGVVYQRKRKDGRYYPTRLAVSLATVASSAAVEAKEGFLIVETNYRVYAYTTSELQVSLLALFCEMQYRLPNMSVGVLSRDSCRNAFRVGITAHQILAFLHMHAHPKMMCRNPPIPLTVSDQIVLWERERNRFICNEAFLYSQFLSQEDFLVVKNFAANEGSEVMLYSNDQKRQVVVTPSGHEVVRKYWKSYRKGMR